MRLLIFFGIFSLFDLSAHAEVVFDGTIGRPEILNGPIFDIRADLGQQQGYNLFHSFQSFNLSEGEIANFSGPDTIENVISRVTGGTSSTIDGTLNSTMPYADMYFLNPAGIILGKNAQLNVPGAMHFSTADELRFSDGSIFSISQPKLMFTTATPEAFGFLNNTPAKITVGGGNLSVKEGETLSLIGGNIDLQSASILSAPAGRLNLASIATPGQVIIKKNDLAVSNFTQRGHLTAEQVNLKVDSEEGKGAGSIYIRGGQIEFNDSQLDGKPQEQDGGVVDIDADDLTLSQTDISVSTLGIGNSGNISINAKGTVNIAGLENGLFANSIGDGEGGNGGKISITSQDLHLTEGATIGNGTFNTGLGGEIAIQATGTVTLSESALIYSNSEGIGDAGIISIKADKLILTDGSQITSSTFGAGKGGTLIIEVMDTVSLAGYVVIDDDIYPSGITTSSLAEGDAGTIRLTAKHLKINQGANIESATYWGVDLDGITYNSTGKSGVIIIDTTASIEIAGKVENSVATEQRIVSSITSASQGTDNGGQVIINTPLLILTDSAQITTSVERDHSEAGSIELRIAQLQANDQAAITSESFGEGDAGNININASDCITVNHAKISTEAKEAAGGNIIITRHYVKSWEQKK